MGLLVLYGSVGASQYRDAHINRLVGQHSAISITGYGLVVNAIEPALCL